MAKNKQKIKLNKKHKQYPITSKIMNRLIGSSLKDPTQTNKISVPFNVAPKWRQLNIRSFFI